MKIKLILSAIAILTLLNGCTSVGNATANVVKALGADTNSVVIDVTGWGGTVHITRNMPYQK